MRILLLVLAAPLLSGCAGSPIGDAIAGPEKLAAQDDGYCQSIGAKPGTSDYINCRMIQASRRDASHARSYEAMRAAQPTTTTCSTFGTEVTCQTR